MTQAISTAASDEAASMTAPHLHSMNTFDPWQPAIVHDRKSDQIETWTGEHAVAYVEESRPREDGSVEWREYLFDGWGNVLGG